MVADPAEDYQQSKDITDSQQFENLDSKVTIEENVSLLEERLIVEFVRRKSGEVVIRKEIETCLLQVEVPVRREKLIVEQVSPEYKRLAEINLGQESFLNGAIDNLSQSKPYTFVSIENDAQHLSIDRPQSLQKRTQRTFNSIESAKNFLDQIATQFGSNNEAIHIEIVSQNLGS